MIVLLPDKQVIIFERNTWQKRVNRTVLNSSVECGNVSHGCQTECDRSEKK